MPLLFTIKTKNFYKNQMDPQILNNEQEEQKLFYGLLLRIGALGKYQYICLIIWCTLYTISASLLFMNPYLFYQAPYKCNGLNESQCNRFVCSLPQNLRAGYLDTESKSMIDKFKDYRCQSQTQINLFQSVIYFSAVVGLFLGIFMNSYIRKKLVLQICLFISICCFLALLFIENLLIMVTLMSVNYAFQSILISFITLFITESLLVEERGKHTLIAFIFYSVGCILNGILFKIASWEHVICFYFIVPLISIFILLMIYIKDPPFDMVIHFHPEKAHEYLHWIAVQNGNEDSHSITVQQVQKIQQEYITHMRHKKQQIFYLSDLFKFESIRLDVVCCCSLHFLIGYSYGSPLLAISQFSASIYTNDIVFSIAALASSIFCYFTIDDYPRKKVMNYTTIISLILVMPLFITFNCRQNCQQFIWIETILIFAFRFLLQMTYQSYILIQNEVFPVQIISLAALFSGVFGQFSAFVTPFVIDLNEKTNFALPASLFLSGILILLSSYRIRQTAGIPPPQIIQELAYQVKSTNQKTKDQSQLHQ